jgi:hypothetical protein
VDSAEFDELLPELFEPVYVEPVDAPANELVRAIA